MDCDETGQKTILVVEDDDMVLGLIAAILNRRYHVLLASGSIEALKTASDYPDVIDLLLSDITMPTMSGIQLATEIRVRRPDIKVMFVSGFYEGPLLVLNHGWRFLRKPFIPAELLTLVEATLNSKAYSQGVDHFDTRY